MKKNNLFFFFFISLNCLAQFSKTHYIPPLAGSNNVAVQEQYLYISTPSVTPVKFTIKELGGATISGTVSQNSPYIHNAGYGVDTQLHVHESLVYRVLKNKGYIIEAEDVVYVTARVLASSGNHAGELVSKGLAALGTQFRIGGFLNKLKTSYWDGDQTFISVMATENNTTIDFNDINTGAVLINFRALSDIVLSAGESFVIAVKGPTEANRDALIGSLVTSDKPIAVNCGSFGGSNGDIGGNADLGFDQIVPAERTGKEYIFIKSTGQDVLERILLIANEDNTNIHLSGNIFPDYTLNAGEYVALMGSDYSANGNLYVRAAKNIFAYQSVGDDGRGDQANQEMFFVPPLSCQTPKEINNIPSIDQIGGRTFTGRVTIVTEKGSPLNFILNTFPYTLATLPSNIKVVGPTDVIGNSKFVTYTITGFTGDVSVFSTTQLYLAAYGSDGAATFGGFYSGFTFKPEIIFRPIIATKSNCIPNVNLKVSSLSGFDTFQWYFNNSPILSETRNNYAPTMPGYYHLSATLLACSLTLESDKIPVSECPTNLDNDLAYDNIDIDNDNDGITNCTESYGNQNINTSNAAAGTIIAGSYSNSFTGVVSTTGTGVPKGTFKGNTDGSFVTEVPPGKENSVTYTMTFAKPLSVGIEYVNTSNTTDLLNADAQYIVNSDVDKTITVLNPNNQLLIDTNYDGIYESGVAQHSSFEIRFRLNSSVPLTAGMGTFKFLTYLSNTISFTHKNLSGGIPNNTTLKFFAICVPKDSDSDGIADQLDLDSDNDGIPDSIEAQANNPVLISNTDTNLDGLDNKFEPGFTPVDTDSDGIPDYTDLDSDNDGILDSVESVVDTDDDAIKNYRDSDSDNDLCNDVIEAGFTDANGDGFLGGIAPPTINVNGAVTSGTGYTIPNVNYITPALILITTQPKIALSCEFENIKITVTDNGGNNYQWQVSIDNGTNWTDIANNTIYTGSLTNTLSITNVVYSMNGFKYRVRLSKVGNSCGLFSSEPTLTISALPPTNNVTIIQCDDDLDAVSIFNLTVKNNVISSNSVNQIFTYYTTLNGAYAKNTEQLITTPLAFINTTPGTMKVWVRVENPNGCFKVAELTLQVLATQIPSTFKRVFKECDDFLDGKGVNNVNNNKRDGITAFNFSSVTTDIRALLPAGNYNINYYKSQADALAELNVISNISNYRNIGNPGTQQIWGRVDSDVDNACYGLGPFVTLDVEALPFANALTIPRQCDDNQDGIFTFNTAALETNLLKGQTNVTVTYFDQANNPLPSPFPATFTTKSQTIKAVVSNNSALKCFDETTIQFIVDDLPQAFTVPAYLTTTCDDEINPLAQDGLFAFDTSAIESTILGTQTGMKVKYFDASGNPLSSPLPNPFITRTQNVKAVVENPINITCSALAIIPFVVQPLPEISLNTNGSEDELICSILPTFLVQLDAGILDNSPTSSYTYIWSKDGTVLPGQTGYSLHADAEGIYAVEVINLSGCSRIRTLKVTYSDIAHIQSIVVVDLTDVNTVTINVSGAGNYEYSLDGPSGYFQDSNFFNNVPPGIHEVSINDKNGCEIVSQTIAVIGVPKFFTPNNDGFNDYWNIKGVSATFNSKSTIYIFNRYGKLLKQVVPSTQGWDGTFNGAPLPSDDYWYSIKLEDGRESKGHFSLKR